MKTKFAPAERASRQAIERAVSLFTDAESVQKRIKDEDPFVFVILNQQRQIVYGNKAVSSLLERPGAGFLGMRPGDLLDCEHATETEGGCGTTRFCSTCGAVKAILSALNGVEEIQECQVTRRSDGRGINLRVWARPFCTGEERFTLFVAQDIEHEKRREALERVFFHDVLNTVTAAHGYARLLETQPEVAGPEVLGKVSGLIKRLADEIEAQRDLSAFERDQYQVSYERIDAGDLLLEITGDFDEDPIAEGVRIELAEAAGQVQLETDPRLVRRVLVNMLKNAIEASGAGDTVSLGCERTGGRVRFRVHNPAVMPERVQLQLFRKSFSTKGTGRGLGTYSMRLLCERFLGGEVRFTSAPGVGTTFEVRLPAGGDAPAT
jgi:signal transduction histidine kinase